MVSSSFRSSQALPNEAGPSSSPMMAIKRAKSPSTKTKGPWPLDTFWSSSNKKGSPIKSHVPHPSALASSYDSSNGVDSEDQAFDFQDLPLTPPDSGASGFQLGAATTDSQPPSSQHGAVLVADATPSPVLLTQDQIKTSPRRSSKNDIFNSPITWVTPPSRFNQPPTETTPISPPPPSRNSLFFSSSGAASPVPPSPPPPRFSSAQAQVKADRAPSTPSVEATASIASVPTSASALQQTQQTAGRKKGHTRNSSLGRASSEECLQEEARIRSTKHVDFRLCPTNEFLLGEGRHCSVYLGSYRPRKDATTDPASSAEWQLCAIKRLHADRQSQLLGLEEAFALRRLGVHPNIIQLIDIRDEVDLLPSPQPTPHTLPDLQQASTDRGSTGLDLGLRLPRIASGASSPNGFASHSRSTSHMTGRDELMHEAQTRKLALAHDKQHEAALARGIVNEADHTASSGQAPRARVSTVEVPFSANLPTPTFLVQGPDGDALTSVRSSDDTATIPSGRKPSTSAMDPPRLLILLELLPNNLALFARKHREQIDLHRWFDWALQMADALVFLHDKGCVHADIKKENMLLTEDLNIKLCDFNSAVFPNPNDPPRDGLGLGTPAYCAPELSRATGGPTATTFSYPIDIFSLGAVLYSLATGCEPFSKARSVVEMLHRKRLFFESEENDRASRLAVEAGSNPNSAPASRRSSLRGRHSTSNEAASSAQLVSSLNRLLHQPSSPTHMRRQTSSDSIDSVASSITSITTMSGRNATSLAVARLLEPSDEPRGLLEDPNLPRRSGSLLRDGAGTDVRRCASTGGRKAMAAGMAGMQRSRAAGETSSPSAASGVPTPPSAITKFAALEATSRPDWLRRRSSYGDELKSVPPSTAPLLAPAAPIVEHPSRLRSMFAPASPHTPSPTSPQPPEARVPETDDVSAYEDGHPAIVLPGGGRLPDSTRELLRLMLQADPAARPSALQVRERLRAHAHHI